MKLQTNNVFGQMSREQLSNLTTVVKETLAVIPEKPKQFNIVDLWNIQRRCKTSFNRRY